MGKKLLVTIFMLSSMVSNAQQQQDERYVQKSNTQYEEPAAGNDGYEEIETVENNIGKASAADTAQEDYFKGSNEAKDTQNSPQINIYNANSNANKQNQKNKADSDAAANTSTTVNTDADLGANYVSRANEIRNARKSMEIGTEQKMVEKIEWSRIEDEKDRADRLFGNRLDKKAYNDDYEEEKTKVVVVEKQPAYPATPAPAPAYTKPAPVAYDNSVSTDEPTKGLLGSETYIAPVIGTMKFNSASNVNSDVGLGVLFGTRFDSNFSIEGSFIYSSLTMDDAQLYENINGKKYVGFKNVDQYGFGVGIKYNFVEMGKVVPHIGGLLGYTYRDFQETRLGDQSATSTAVDAGISLGADIKITKNFSLGGEYRWMKNVSFSRDNSDLDNTIHPANQAKFGKTGEPLESLGYQMFLVSGKFSF